MKKNILICTILLMLFGCYGGTYDFGFCNIYYDNIDKMLEQSITVSATDRYNITRFHTLKPDSNEIFLELDDGYFYYLTISGIRTDSIHSVYFKRYGHELSKVRFYSFMFNEDSNTEDDNNIRISL